LEQEDASDESPFHSKRAQSIDDAAADVDDEDESDEAMGSQ
jgi:hypothetical protein